jgi:predicted membrane protein DUF2142
MGEGRRFGGSDPRALVCGLLAALAICGALALVLSRTAQHRTGTNGVWTVAEVRPVIAAPGQWLCQRDELLPAGTGAIRLAVASAEPRIALVLRRGSRVLTRATAVLEPNRGAVARISPPVRDLAGVQLCARSRAQPVVIPRGATPPDVGALRVGSRTFVGSMKVDYLEGQPSSWWTQISTVARRLGLGHGDWGGGWIPWALVVLLGASLALTARVLLRTVLADRRMAVAATIAAIAACNAVAWSLITPAFQVPDELVHLTYAQRIGETGGPPPKPRETVLSPEVMIAMADTRYGGVNAATIKASVWSPLQQDRLLRDLHARPSRRPSRDVGESEPEPPLYYALQAIPYRVARGATLLDRIMLMRLCSALLAGITALLAFLFVREVLPAKRWAWSVGGLGVAFLPMLGFISGGVNADALLFAVSAALFLCLARAFRRGVTTRLAVWTGVVLAIGLLTKVNFYGLVPPALLAFALAARAGERVWNRRVARALGIAVGIAVMPLALVTAVEALAWGRPFVIGRAAAPESHVGLGAHFSYVWQILLPRLPGQKRLFAEYPAYEDLFKTFVGAFGAIVARFPAWGYRLAVGLFAGIGVLATRGALARRVRLHERRAELFGYAAMAAALVLLIAISADLRRNVVEVVQGRYLLPLATLLAAVFALAARGAGERWGRAVGVVIVVLAIGWTLFGQLVTIAFFSS